MDFWVYWAQISVYVPQMNKKEPVFMHPNTEGRETCEVLEIQKIIFLYSLSTWTIFKTNLTSADVFSTTAYLQIIVP